MCNKYYKLRNMRDGLNKEDHIYKYIPLKYVLMMVGNKQLLMNKVNSWEDPYENFFYKEDFKMPDGRQVSALDLTNGIFGQSWTLLEESDAMWRIYSQNKDAIKIKTTAEKLFNIIYTDDACMATSYIGKVNYFTQSKIQSWISSLSLEYSNINQIATESMFMKRDAFSHEQEVRIIKVLDSYATERNKVSLSYDIDPEYLIDEYCLDPRLDDYMTDVYKQGLIHVGVNPTKITKSRLYEFTPQTINLR